MIRSVVFLSEGLAAAVGAGLAGGACSDLLTTGARVETLVALSVGIGLAVAGLAMMYRTVWGDEA